MKTKNRKRKPTEWFRLPDGESTRNVDEMIKAWQDIYVPICKGLNVSVVGFDPGILFKDNENNKCFDIPVSLAIRIRDLVNRANK